MKHKKAEGAIVIPDKSIQDKCRVYKEKYFIMIKANSSQNLKPLNALHLKTAYMWIKKDKLKRQTILQL